MPLGAFLGLRRTLLLKDRLCPPSRTPEAGRALPAATGGSCCPSTSSGPGWRWLALFWNALRGPRAPAGQHSDLLPPNARESVRCPGGPEASEAPLHSEDMSPPGPFSPEGSLAQRRPEVARRPPLPITTHRASSVPPDLEGKEGIKPALSPAIAAGHRGTPPMLQPCCVAACPCAPQPCSSATRRGQPCPAGTAPVVRLPARVGHLRTPNTNK